MRRKASEPRTKAISVRLPLACFERAQRAGAPLSKLIEYGLQKMILTYPNIREGIMERLTRHGNSHDVLENGSRRLYKYRIHVEHLEFLRYSQLNVSAAIECAVLDFL